MAVKTSVTIQDLPKADQAKVLSSRRSAYRYEEIRQRLRDLQPGQVIVLHATPESRERVRNSVLIYLRQLRDKYPGKVWDTVRTKTKDNKSFFVIAYK